VISGLFFIKIQKIVEKIVEKVQKIWLE